MAMAKSDVRNFVILKIVDRKKELQDEINTIIEKRVNPILDSMYDSQLLGVLARVSQQFIDLLNEARAVHPYLEGNIYHVNQGIYGARTYGVNLAKNLRSNLRTKLKNHLENPLEKALSVEDLDGSDELYHAAQCLLPVCKPLYKKYNDLEVLSKELGRAIDNEPSGKRAYKAMLAAGVDMAEFEEQQKSQGNLPMVVNLSVDVCLINRTC